MLRNERAGTNYRRGQGLRKAGALRIEVAGRVVGYLDDHMAALGWVKAAQRAGVDAALYV
jgi:hypothetical protein